MRWAVGPSREERSTYVNGSEGADPAVFVRRCRPGETGPSGLSGARREEDDQPPHRRGTSAALCRLPGEEGGANRGGLSRVPGPIPVAFPAAPLRVSRSHTGITAEYAGVDSGAIPVVSGWNRGKTASRYQCHCNVTTTAVISISIELLAFGLLYACTCAH